MIGISGVDTAADLYARGMSRASLRHAVHVGRLVRVRRGVYCDGELWRAGGRSPVDRHAIEATAAWLVFGRRGWVTGYSAALLQGFPVPQGEPHGVTYALPRRDHGRRTYDGIRLRTTSLHARDIVLARGVPASGPPRTAIEVAREHGFAAGLVIADACRYRGVVEREDLRGAAARVAGWPGGRQAGLVAEFSSDLRESPAESLSFAAFVESGLPLPECNAWVVGHGVGGVRADFRWRVHRLVGEVDGRVKYVEPFGRSSEKVLVDEKNRQLRIEEAGFVVVRWTGAEAMYRPEVVVERIIRQSAVAADMFGVPALTLPRRMAR